MHHTLDPTQLLFVYGTLRQYPAGSKSGLLGSCCEYLGPGWVQGRLYALDGYPGMVPSACPDDLVHGELYRLHAPQQVLALLDEYEECSDAFAPPHEYVRKRVQVQVRDGACREAWAYLYNRDSTGLQRIHYGDYLQFCAERIDGIMAPSSE